MACSFILGQSSMATLQEFSVHSDYQDGAQNISVLTPDSYSPEQKYRVLYVLPTESGPKAGHMLKLFRDGPRLYDVIVVTMTFEKQPWFGDHATDPAVRQASYMKEYVVPFVEEKFSTLGTPAGRLLLGFSKSGWGAISLILHDPDYWGFAASWDAPLMFDRMHYGMKDVYGSQEQLDRWRPDLLAQRNAAAFKDRTRLVIAGEDLWGTLVPSPGGGTHTTDFHELLDRQGIRHAYLPELRCKHRWAEEWIHPVVKELMNLGATERNR
jgi:enterochelin esterase-like enzyme